MSRYTLSWKIAGEAGFGIKNAGLIFARSVNRAGYSVFGYVEYPSLIRGGHNTYQVTVSETAVRSAAENVDLVIALNKEGVVRHLKELNTGAVVLYDRDEYPVSLPASAKEINTKLVHVPFAQIVRQVGGLRVMRNIAALGASHAVLGLPLSNLTQIVKKTLGHKSSIIEKNLKVAEKGYEYIQENYPDLDYKVRLEKKKAAEELLLTGNEATALGAIAAGLQMYVAYPMTPSSTILHYLAKKASSQRMIVKHAEDEISVINMALGASHTGARTMVGTSGGGFALMNEGLGLTGLTETPLVIAEVQRPGPATGLPTWTDQGDLRFVMHSAQGEFPRIIITPGDHEEAFYLTAEAFNYADKFQMPVIVLTDKFLAESDRTVTPFDISKVTVDRGQAVMTQSQLNKVKEYKRYKVTKTGVSPRSVPGQKGGIYLANSDEHDEFGYSNEDAENRIAQVHKRAQKFNEAMKGIKGYNVYGPSKAKTTIVSWGSTKGPVLDAMAWLPARYQKKVKFLHITIPWPFPSKAVHSILSNSSKVLLVENNSTAQLGGLIRQYTGIHIDRKFLKYDGRPMYPAEIKERIMNL